MRLSQKDNLLKSLQENPFVLAPMAGITDSAFRSFMRHLGCGVVVTELVSATGLSFKSARTQKLMAFTEDQHPVGVQLFGDDPLHLGEAAKEVQDLGADFVDLNFGCPVPKVVKKGAGSAMMKDLPAMKKILQSVRASIQIPLTIKIRTGWEDSNRNAGEVVRLAADEGVSWVAIHGRTRAQGYSGSADWDFISEVKSQSPIPIIGNGDIVSAKMAVDRLTNSGCDGVMIGRGCLRNPFIFQQARERLAQKPETTPMSYTEVFKLLKHYLEKSVDSDRIMQIQLKKFAAWYSSGYSGAAAFRKEIFQLKAVNEIMDFAIQYFNDNNKKHEHNNLEHADSVQDNFLMGGHG